MVVVLLILILLSLVTVSLLSTLGTMRSAARSELRRAQAVWLAESGLERASSKASADPDYQGETWRIPASELGGDREAEVVIAVSRVPNAPDRRAVRVRADYPAAGDDRARRTLEAEITIKNPKSEPEPKTEQAP